MSFLFTVTAQKTIEASGRNFDIFQFKHGKYGEYLRRDVADFVALSDVEYKKIKAKRSQAIGI